MRFAERHVLTVNKPSVVRKVLDAFSMGVQAQGCVSPQTRRGLVEFSKQGFNRLILNLQVIKAPFPGASAAFAELDVCEVGGVLVLTGQIPEPWMLQAEELCRSHFFPRHPISSFGAFISRAAAGLEAGILRIARAAGKRRTNPRHKTTGNHGTGDPYGRR